MPKYKNSTTPFEDNATQLTELGDSYTRNFEQYSYRAGDDLPFDPDPFPEDEEESQPSTPKKAPKSKPLKCFGVKLVWTYREGKHLC
jgi:hypothetical protein